MNYDQQSAHPFGGRGVTKYVRSLLIINCSVYLVQLLLMAVTNTRNFETTFSLSLHGILTLKLWQPLTYMFLHADPMHLLFNMVGLYMFGTEIEQVLGSRKFIRMYILWGIIAGLGWMILDAFSAKYGWCIGASGAVLGLLGCYAGLYPERFISLIFPPVTLKARTFVLCLSAFSVLMMVSNTGRVAHSAHLFGCLAGYIYGLRIYKNPGVLDADMYRKNGGGSSISTWISDIKAKIRRRNFTVVSHEEPPPTQDEIDRILDKLHTKGMNSLTVRERQALRRASDKK
jgi:membrane associated rhomboid family serine protease